ncbi:MAG: hypothetical protein ACRCT8_16130 [Lacipirellulaceae bacterium]
MDHSPNRASGSLVQAALRGVARNRAWLVVSSVLGVAAGGLAAAVLGTDKHTVDGKMLYSPSRATAPYYESPPLGNLVQLIKTPQLAERLKKDCQLGEGLFEINQFARLDVGGDSTLIARVTRKSESEAKQIVERLMELAEESARDIRRRSVQRVLIDLESEEAAARQTYASARDKFQHYLEENGVPSPAALESETTALQLSANEYEIEAELARVDRTASEAQRDRLMEALVGEAPAEGPQEGGVERAGFEGASDEDNAQRGGSGRQSAVALLDANRRDELSDRIRREQEVATYKVQRENKQKELERAERLFSRQLIGEAALERIRGEVQLLEAQRGPGIEQMQRELEAINERLASRRRRGADGSVTTASALTSEPSPVEQTLALLDGGAAGAKYKAERLGDALEVKREQIDDIAAVVKNAEPFRQDVAVAEAEWRRVETIRNQFRQAEHATGGELSVVHHATPVIGGQSSNAPKVFGAVALLTGLLLTAPSLLREVRGALRERRAVAPATNLPLLARIDSSTGGDSARQALVNEAYGLLALRMQRTLGEGAPCVVLAGVESEDAAREAAVGVANSLARGGAAVTLVDLAASAPVVGPPANLGLRPEVTVSAALEFFTPAGELVAPARLEQEIASLRSGDAAVVVVAPTVADRLFVESLACHADGLALVTSGEPCNGNDIRAAIDGVMEVGGRVLGVIELRRG